MCPLSERGCRHPLLFAVLDLLVLLDQAKSTRKESVRKNFPINFSGIIPSQCLGDFLRGATLPPFVTKRWRQKCPQGTSVGIGRRFSLSGHKRLRCCGAKDCTASTVAARQSPQAASALACCPSFCTPAPGARTAVRSDSSSGAMRNLRCAPRNDDYLLVSCFNRSPACRIALRK